MRFAADWRIERGQPSAWPSDVLWKDSSTSLAISRHPDGQSYRLWICPEFDVDVIPNNRIIVRKNDEVPDCTIDHFLADQVLPRLMAYQGSLVFHAGAVRLGKAAIAFLGESGRGKSTLTASFHQAGFTLLGDDAMVLTWLSGEPQIRAVYPSLRLFPDSLKALTPASNSSPVAHYTSKQAIRVPVDIETEGKSLPVQALFCLAAPLASGPIHIRPLTPAQACIALVESGFALDPTNLAHARQRLEDAARLANRVPCFEIAYPRHYGLLPLVRRAILDKLAALEVA